MAPAGTEPPLPPAVTVPLVASSALTVPRVRKGPWVWGGVGLEPGVSHTCRPLACTCTYEGRPYGYQDVIYNTTDGLGACLVATCGDNGTVLRRAEECPGTPTTTPFTFSPFTTGETTWLTRAPDPGPSGSLWPE